MNIIEKTIKTSFYDIYNITSINKKNSKYFRNLLNEIIYISNKNNIQLNNLTLYFNNNQETIVHFLLVSIIDTKLYFKMFDSIYFNNRTDINMNDNWITIKNDYNKCSYYNKNLQKILNEKFNYISQLTYFLFLLLLEINNNILLLPDSRNLTPIQYFSKNFYVYKRRGIDSKNILLYNSLQMVLIYGKNLVIIQQSFIRRYLARRYIIKLKKNICLSNILYSPPKQVEFYNFKYFPGGAKILEKAHEYNKSISKWRNTN